jgi:hypothetical protein
MKNKTTQEQLIELYEQQIQDLVMISKIELGDDVIAKIKELKSQIHKQQSTKQQMIEFGYACTKQIEMNEAGELLMVKSPEELYTQVYGGEMNNNNNPGITTKNPTVRDLIKSYINDVEAFGEELSDEEIDVLYDFALYVDEIDINL